MNGELAATAPLWEHATGCTISSGTLADGSARGADLRLTGMDDTYLLRWLTLLELPVGNSIQIDLVKSAEPDEPTRKLAESKLIPV